VKRHSPDEVLIFDLVGPLAHFRKFYTNTSALTYGFPPRTTLMGVVAAVVGLERDTYYEELDRGRFTVAVKTPTRRLLQTVNYVRTKAEDLGLLRRFGRPPGTQTPLEFLLAGGRHYNLRFRVFFAHPDRALVREAARRLREGRSSFPLYLGLTECLAGAEYRGLYTENDYERLAPGMPVGLTSVLNTAHLDRLELAPAAAPRLVRERAPYAFGPGRTLCPPVSVIYETAGEPLPVRLRVPAYRFRDLAGNGTSGPETIVFLEEEMSAQGGS